jgi:Mrp family chromosome partitioning ATPase
MFGQMADLCDVVIIDSPPVLPVTDAAVLAAGADAVLLVAAADLSARRDITRALELLDRIGALIVGAVLNRATESDSYVYYRYGYQYGYGYSYGGDSGKSENGTVDVNGNGKNGKNGKRVPSGVRPAPEGTDQH